MMLYRCTACTRDHYSQPAACEGCGSQSFAVIHLAPVEGVFQGMIDAAADAELELLYAEAGAVMGSGPQVSRPVASDDAPPTPRDPGDMSAGRAPWQTTGSVVLEGDEPNRLDVSEVPAIDAASREAREQLAADGEEVAVAALRPVVAKAAGVCSQTTCDAPATHRFTWPGHPEAVSCHEHALKAVMLAEHMGFFLEAPAL